MPHPAKELLMAGTDTSAALLEWSLLELVRHPHVMERLNAEIDAKFGMLRPVEEDEAAHLPYLQVIRHFAMIFTKIQSSNCTVERGPFELPSRSQLSI